VSDASGDSLVRKLVMSSITSWFIAQINDDSM
jgi:hypothetical protein